MPLLVHAFYFLFAFLSLSLALHLVAFLGHNFHTTNAFFLPIFFRVLYFSRKQRSNACWTIVWLLSLHTIAPVELINYLKFNWRKRNFPSVDGAFFLLRFIFFLIASLAHTPFHFLSLYLCLSLVTWIRLYFSNSCRQDSAAVQEKKKNDTEKN